MKRTACMALLLAAGLTAGCVERRFVINSDPPGALVYHNGIYLGATPVDGYLTYYGKQQFRLIKEGYETLDVVQKYPPPWYELPGIDFATENINPFKVRDVRCFHYTMQPLQTIRPDDVRGRAEQLRARGQMLGVPPSPRPILVTPPTPPPDLPPPTPLPPTPPGGAALGSPAPVNPPAGPLAPPPAPAPGAINGR
jgi:hypothetical protein